MSYEHPYRGLKVLEIAQGFAGPYCGELFALYGADVVKVEPPEGDWMRVLGSSFGDQTPHTIVANRGKRSIVLDLRRVEGRDLALRLAADCDVFIESFRPGVAARLGLGYDAVRQANPRMLYMSISGFGQDGRYAGRPTTDTVIQAFSGLMSINKGLDGIPHKIDLVVIDTMTGLYAFQALAAALHAREHEAEGRHLEVSLMQSAAAYLAPKIVEHHLEGGSLRPLNAPAGSYRTKDGWLAITLVKEEHFRRICRALGREDIADDPRFADFAGRAENMAVLRPILEELLLGRSTAEWVERFHAADALCNPINDFGDWLTDPHVRETATAPVVEQPGVGAVPMPVIPGTANRDVDGRPPVAPGTGEHGRAILGELGLDDSEIMALAREGITRLPD